MALDIDDRPPTGNRLERARQLIAQPPTFEVMKELILTMLTELRLDQPNLSMLYELWPEVLKRDSELTAELEAKLDRMDHDARAGVRNPYRDETVGDQIREIRRLASELTEALLAKAAEIQSAVERAADFDSDLEILDDAPMSETPGKDYVDARLEAVEARMDGRVAAIESKIDGFMGRMDELQLRADERMTRIESSLAETTNYVRSVKNTVIATAIATVLGIAAFNATVLSNMVASFESGKNTAAAQAEVRRQTEATDALIKQMQQQLDASKGSTPSAQ